MPYVVDLFFNTLRTQHKHYGTEHLVLIDCIFHFFPWLAGLILLNSSSSPSPPILSQPKLYTCLMLHMDIILIFLSTEHMRTFWYPKNSGDNEILCISCISLIISPKTQGMGVTVYPKVNLQQPISRCCRDRTFTRVQLALKTKWRGGQWRCEVLFTLTFLVTLIIFIETKG